MWLTYLLAGIVFAGALTGMAVRVIISNRRIKGNCGGLANLRDAHGEPMYLAFTQVHRQSLRRKYDPSSMTRSVPSIRLHASPAASKCHLW